MIDKITKTTIEKLDVENDLSFAKGKLNFQGVSVRPMDLILLNKIQELEEKIEVLEKK